MEITDIQAVERQFPDEWLLFDVAETDELGRPMRGVFLAHSPSRQALDDYLRKLNVTLPYMVWSGRKPKKGFMSLL